MSTAQPDPTVEIPLELLHDSPFNPRRSYRQIDELAADIKAVGRIVQPLLVRPRSPNPLRDDITEGYEIVFGHRRRRGAEAAGLATAPCMVRAMSDEEVRRVQLSENLQRDDMDAIEQAEGMRALMDECGTTVEQLMVITGKSRTGVYNALKLLELCDPARHAVIAGDLGTEAAQCIARIPGHALQVKALALLKDRGFDLSDTGKSSYRDIRAILIEEFAYDLKRALFDPAAAALVPAAGSCTQCPKRSGNTPELYADITDPEAAGCTGKGIYYIGKRGEHICTDPTCYAEKQRAHLAAQAAAVAAEGTTVVEGAAARAALNPRGEPKGAYIDAAAAKADMAKARKALARQGQDVPEPVLIQNPLTGQMVQAFRRADVAAALKAAGLEPDLTKPKPAQGHGQRDWERERAEREARCETETAARSRLQQAVRAEMQLRPRTVAELRLVVLYTLERMEADEEWKLAALWGHEDSRAGAQALRDRVPDLEPADLARLLLDCMLCDRVWVDSYSLDQEPTYLIAAAREYGIDVDQARADPAAAPASTPSPAARAGKGTARRRPRAAAGAAAASADEGPAGHWSEQAKARIQTDDAGCAGGRDARPGDLFGE